MVLELNIANRKVADLETKNQRVTDEKIEKNHGELLFTIILYSISM